MSSRRFFFFFVVVVLSMPTIFPSRRRFSFWQKKDNILHSSKCFDASTQSTPPRIECIFLPPVVPTSTLGIRFERALMIVFGENDDDFGARRIQSSSSSSPPDQSSSCVKRISLSLRLPSSGKDYSFLRSLSKVLLLSVVGVSSKVVVFFSRRRLRRSRRRP